MRKPMRDKLILVIGVTLAIFLILSHYSEVTDYEVSIKSATLNSTKIHYFL